MEDIENYRKKEEYKKKAADEIIWPVMDNEPVGPTFSELMAELMENIEESKKRFQKK